MHPLNDWKMALSSDGRINPHIPDLHVLIAFKKKPDGLAGAQKISGGIIFEYFKDINCGLFNYLIIQRKHRNKVLLH